MWLTDTRHWYAAMRHAAAAALLQATMPDIQQSMMSDRCKHEHATAAILLLHDRASHIRTCCMSVVSRGVLLGAVAVGIGKARRGVDRSILNDSARSATATNIYSVNYPQR